MIKASILKMQIGVLLAFLLAGAHNTYSSQEQEYHFRHTRWGMSQEEVRKAENGDPEPNISRGSSLVWKAELLGEQVLVVYTFAFNKLVRAKYMLGKYNPIVQRTLKPLTSQKKPTAGEFILDFEKFEKALIEKYGKPDEHYLGVPKEVNEDKDQDPKVSIDIIEEAIRTQKTVWYSTWKTKDSSILLVLSGGNSGAINFEISYSSIALSRLEKDAPF